MAAIQDTACPLCGPNRGTRRSGQQGDQWKNEEQAWQSIDGESLLVFTDRLSTRPERHRVLAVAFGFHRELIRLLEQ